MNLIENWGSGVKRYIERIKDAGLREPEFIVWSSAVRVNVYRQTNGRNEPNHEPNEPNHEPNEPNREPNEPNREPNEPNREPNDGVGARVLRMLSSAKDLTIDDLSESCGVSRETIKRAIKSLKGTGRIRRIGGTRGHWEAIG